MHHPGAHGVHIDANHCQPIDAQQPRGTLLHPDQLVCNLRTLNQARDLTFGP